MSTLLTLGQGLSGECVIVLEVRCFALAGRSVRPSHRGAEQHLSLVGMAAGADWGCGLRSAQLKCKA